MSIEYSLLGVVWGRILSRLSTKVILVTATCLFHFHTFALSENCCDKLSSELGSALAQNPNSLRPCSAASGVRPGCFATKFLISSLRSYGAFVGTITVSCSLDCLASPLSSDCLCFTVQTQLESHSVREV